jgi:hypothetical protein
VRGSASVTGHWGNGEGPLEEMPTCWVPLTAVADLVPYLSGDAGARSLKASLLRTATGRGS